MSVWVGLQSDGNDIDVVVGLKPDPRRRAKSEANRDNPMPNVMIRKKDDGALLFYVAKKDMEETIASVETDTAEAWGGEVELTDGSRWYVDPISPPPAFPTTLRFKRAGE